MWVFESDRLRFREMIPEDTDDLFAMHTNDQVMKYIGMPKWSVRKDSTDYIFKNMKSYRSHGFGRWMVEEKNSGEWLGLAGLLVDATHGFIDLGYRFNPAHWGKGYATEAAAAVLRYGFSELQLETIRAHAACENLASVRVLEKLGFLNCGKGLFMGIEAHSFQMDAENYKAQSTAQSPQ